MIIRVDNIIVYDVSPQFANGVKFVVDSINMEDSNPPCADFLSTSCYGSLTREVRGGRKFGAGTGKPCFRLFCKAKQVGDYFSTINNKMLLVFYSNEINTGSGISGRFEAA